MKRDAQRLRTDGIGARLQRKEDTRLLTGQGTFVDDLSMPGERHLVVVRSVHAHAKLLGIDARGLAEAFPEVVLFTAADLAPDCRIPIRIAGGAQFAPYLQPPLAQDRVRYVGEPVAAVVGRTLREAEAAAEALQVDYEPLVPVLDCARADEPGMPRVHEAGNCAARFEMVKGDAPAALAAAPVVLERSFSIQRHTGVPLEPRGLVASYDRGSGRLRVWGPTKLPYVSRAILSRLLGLSEQDITFVEPDVGGSFGVRGEFYPEDLLVPLAALRLGRPVKWTETRREHFLAINHSREQRWKLRLGATREGRLLALDAELVNDTGAYVRTHGTVVAHHGGTSLPGPYYLEHYRCRVACTITNKTPTGTMRAPGMFEASFVRERALDLLAAELGIDPVEIRRRNFLTPQQLPYLIYPDWHGPYKPLYDNGDFEACFRRTLEQWSPGRPASFEAEASGSLRIADGMACAVEPSGLGPFERARLRVDLEGRFYLYVGTTSQGQGQETTFAQICAELLDVPAAHVTVRHGNTDEMPTGYGTNASRGAVVGGKAVAFACEALLAKAKALAARRLKVAEADVVYEFGRFHAGPRPEGAGLGWRELALSVSPLAFHGGQPVPGLEPADALEALAHAGNVQEGTSVFSVHWARVSVDLETGEVRVLRYLVSCDIGRSLNPMVVEGQLHGGVAMGLGGTLAEELVYDEAGQLNTASFMDYAFQNAASVPPIETLVLEATPSPSNPLGVKGVGEVGTSGVAGAVANAVANALRGTGAEIRDLPLTAARVRSMLQGSLLQSR